jgi:acyl-coenzyme A thioesterase PaaI-like protein
MNKKQKRVRNSRSDIRARVIDALLRNRTPGFHFPGFFLGLEWIIAAKRVIVQSMPVGAHCTDAHGVAHIGAIGVMLDTGLALPRLKNDPFARHATVHVVTQFRESIPSGDIWMKVKSDGVTKGAAVKRALSSGSLTSPSGKRTPFCSASSALVSLPRPAGSVLAELPKNLTKRRTKISSKTLKLDEEEREILGVCDRAIASADAEHSFIEHFWGFLPRASNGGAMCRPQIGPHMTNRVNHVHGGILLGWAAATASAAVPLYPVLSSFAASFIRPGTGPEMMISSQVSHAGRSFAVVHTKIRNITGECVLEALSHHAATQSSRSIIQQRADQHTGVPKRKAT